MHSSTDGDSLSQGQEHEQADVMQWTPAQPPSNDMAPGPADQTPAGTGPLPGPPPEPTTNKSLGGSLNIPWNPRDPRTSSTQSLASSTDPRGQKRKLLIIYIHGYKGSTTSFRSFPAHVHNLLKILLAETHVVHTKIYPRYKTYRSISVACENFSQWLAPHESPTTDVVLVGHSMGGLLAAEVALLPSQGPYSNSWPFRHRILGTVSLDAPLLGLHPGVIISGISSLFRPSPKPGSADRDSSSSSSSESSSPAQPASPLPPSGASSPNLTAHSSSLTVSTHGHEEEPDPHFNPAFPNDVSYVDRGWFKNTVHFIKKYKDENLLRAAAAHVMSHLEYASCLTDYHGLRTRYNKIRQLEDGIEWQGQPGAVRVRFVNYYTVSTGRVKKAKSSSSSEGRPRGADGHWQPARSSLEFDRTTISSVSTNQSRVSTPRISIEEYTDASPRRSVQTLDSVSEVPSVNLDTTAQPESQPTRINPLESTSPQSLSQEPAKTRDLTPSTSHPPPPGQNLPFFPPPPSATSTSSASASSKDKLSRKAALAFASKAYKAALDKTLQTFKPTHVPAAAPETQPSNPPATTITTATSSSSFSEQQEQKQQEQEQEQAATNPPPSPSAVSSDIHLQNHHPMSSNPNPPPPSPPSITSTTTTSKPKKRKQKRRKFCTTPHHNHHAKHSHSHSHSHPTTTTTTTTTSGVGAGAVPNGEQEEEDEGECCPDPTWIQVFMPGVDEVGAHCGLFVADAPHYERLVGDVGERVAGWVWEDASRRAVFGF
ncbi:hypothetical protein VTJ04DRAFT_6168 [Mycothermus thermophilus]|uniref:uncharacterized protein n=1 Tax=Humicola insolens TaxID=85995 RepID=UPI0037434BB7